MAITVFTLAYTSNDWSTNNLHALGIQLNAVTWGPSIFRYRVVDTVIQSFDVQKGVTLTETVTNIKARIDQVILLTVGTTGAIYCIQTGNTLRVYVGTQADNTLGCFYNPETNNGAELFPSCFTGASYFQATLDVRQNTFIVPAGPTGPLPTTGLGSNGYSLNNDIYLAAPSFVTTTGLDLTTYYSIVFKNLTNQRALRPIEVYPISGKGIVLNISPILKSLFDYPAAGNNYGDLTPFEATNSAQSFEVTIQRYHTTASSNVQVYEETKLSKTFLRAGERSNASNLTTSPGEVLRPTTDLPIWAGYPTAEYVLSAAFKIMKYNDLSTLLNVERLPAKGCDPVYIKFLNQKGGYSNWLFEGITEKEGATPLGFSNNLGTVTDLGKDFDGSAVLYSKVATKWLPLLQDLVVSPEVLLYTGGNTWTRIVLSANTIEYNNYKKAYEVKISYKKITNFNPSLIW